MNTFGQKLKQARENRGLTQQELGEKLFVTRQTISRYESDNRLPDIHTFKAISEILDISMDELLSDHDLQNHCNTQPIHNDQKEISILIILYTLIICIHAILMVQSFPSFSIHELSYPVVLIQTFLHGIQIILFLYGITALIRNDFNAKQAGIITTVFLLTEALQLLCTYLFSNPVSSIVFSLPYMIGTYAAYLFYFRENDRYRIIMILISVYAICMQLYGTYALLMYADHLYTSLHTFNRIGSILINITLIHQVNILYRRRLLTGKK